ncbi:MAG: hypothetical protein AAF733_12505 [Verrucomicrobiota bacterium]
MRDLGPNIRLLSYPLSLFGMKVGRQVTLFRLSSGKLVIHSTAPFPEADVNAIREFGEPTWLLDATNFHDTLTRPGVAAFPDLPYLVPDRFPLSGKVKSQPLEDVPAEWEGELDVIKIDGMPSINEHVFFHRKSKTLVVADLLFNLPDSVGAFTLGFLRLISGIKQHPGNSRMFRLAIQDRDAFESSLQKLLALDFAQIIVAHGEPIAVDAKSTLARVFRELGYAV